MKNLNNPVLITGGANGIGRSIAEKLSKNNFSIFIIDKDKKKLKRAKSELLKYANDVQVYNIDLCYEEQIYEFLDYLKKEKIIIKHLINNAGYQENIDILKLSLENWRNLFKVNLEAPFLLSQGIAKEMIAKKIKGSIINITSIHARIIRNIAHYSSSKAALEMLTKEMAYKLAKYGIRVNAIAPGAINTPLIRQDLYNKSLFKKATQQVPLGRLADPEDIAHVVEFLLSGKAEYITGTTITVDGGLSLVI